MHKLIFLALCLGSPLLAEEENLARRVYAHLVIKDELKALSEAQKAIKIYPHSKILRQAYIKVLALAGHEEKAWQSYKEYVNLFADDPQNRDLLEALAWGVIHKSAKSSSPILRILSLIAANSSDDAKSVTLVHQALDDPNNIVRQVSLEVASSMRDAKLCHKIMEMLAKEKDWNVRIKVIDAAGKMKIRKAEKLLINIVANSSSTLEEKAAASQSILLLMDNVERGELLRLVNSSRADLRKLCAMIIGHLGNESDLDLVATLLDDSQAEVRKTALQALGSFPLLSSLEGKLKDKLQHLLHDNDPEVAIYAGWVLGKYHSDSIPTLFAFMQKHDEKDVRIMATAAFAALGSKTGHFLMEAFEQAKDPYVKMNLAMALIKERISLAQGVDALYYGVENSKERWMLKDYGVFEAIAPSDIKHNTLISNFPEVNNQLIRLQVLNILAMMRHPLAKNAIQTFLKERTWGITGLSASLLLTEGDEAAIEIVQTLLKDSNSKVRVQAALVLSLWGAEENAIQTLKQAYPASSREVKEQILEGMGSIGLPSCLPFLVEKLNEPFQSLRIIAASSILQCLYH